MRQLIVSEFITVDGVIEAPGGEPTHPHTGWVSDYFSDELGAYKSEEVFEAESLLLGRVTWESFSGAWPTYEGEMAVRMNAMPKHVVSSTLTDPGWNSTVISGDVVAAVKELKASDGGPIMVERQRDARAHADRARPRRPLPAHGVPGLHRRRPAPVPGLAEEDVARSSPRP